MEDNGTWKKKVQGQLGEMNNEDVDQKILYNYYVSVSVKGHF